MAYPSVDSPYGLIPINLIGGQVFAGSTRLLPIAASSTTAIYYGDVVTLLAGGTISRDTGTDSANPVGVFLGCTYTDPVYGKTFRQFYPGGVSATDIQAYVVDDPDALFKVAVCAGTNSNVVSFVTQAAVGSNFKLANGANNIGSTTTGNSKVGMDSTEGTTSTWPLRVVDVVPATAVTGNPGSYTEVVVKWNQGSHRYLNPTGLA
jgi:hypothetical protein